jgi:leucyl aminopeptidase
MAKLVRVKLAGRGSLKADLLAVGRFKGVPMQLDALPRGIARRIQKAIDQRAFPWQRDRRHFIATGNKDLPSVALYGLGEVGELEWRRVAGWLHGLVAEAERSGARSLALLVPRHEQLRDSDAAERIARALALASYHFDEYKEKSKKSTLGRVIVVPPDDASDWQSGLATGELLARASALTRDVANTPPNVASPEWMAERVRTEAEALGVEARILGPDELESRGMGGILAVGSGSRTPPRLVRLEWGEEGPAVALVGKGVTFDTGGISIKPATKMDEMKYDKCGACTVLGITHAVVSLELPIRLRAYLPFAENMPDGGSYRPGDIVRCYNGKTVEIINTDAEGRMLLADALAWAASEEPDVMLEYSTLTGAAVVALGLTGAALYSPDDGLAGNLLSVAGRTGERLWRMPLWSEFRDHMKGTHADLRNSGSRWGGANNAAAFLSNFIDGVPRWAHWDIAGPAYVGADGQATNGATGYGVATTSLWLRRFSAGAD